MESFLQSPKPENRVNTALFLYAEQEAQLKISNPARYATDQQATALKWQFYNNIYQAHKHSKDATPEEKLSLRYVRHEMAKIQAALRPSALNRLLYSRPVNAIRNFANGNNLWYREIHREARAIQQDILFAHNLDTLKQHLKQAGFSLNLDNVLERMLKQDFPTFHIRYADPLRQKDADFTLHFSKIPGTGQYYLQRFDASSRPSLQALLKNEPIQARRSFSLDDKKVFTATEAANLVNGKAVCKEIDGKEQWIMLNNTKGISRENEYHVMKFNLDKALEQLPILELNDRGKAAKLIEGLKTGDVKEVTMLLNGLHQKISLQAAPQHKTVFMKGKNGEYLDKDKILAGRMSNGAKMIVEKSMQPDDDMVIDMNTGRKGHKR